MLTFVLATGTAGLEIRPITSAASSTLAPEIAVAILLLDELDVADPIELEVGIVLAFRWTVRSERCVVRGAGAGKFMTLCEALLGIG
jgi:hypothetical protein